MADVGVRAVNVMLCSFLRREHFFFNKGSIVEESRCILKAFGVILLHLEVDTMPLK
jgi:hypothetical protein